MPYSPFEGFQIGQKVGKANRSALGMESDSVLEQFNKSGETNREIAKLMAVEKFKNTLESPKEKAMTDYYKAQTDFTRQGTSQLGGGIASMDENGMPSKNPALIFTGMSGKSPQFASPEGMRQKGQIENEISAQGKMIDAGGKLGSAVKRLNIINEQLNAALPANNNPLVQRVMGPLAVIGAKTGLVPNPRLLAIKKNIRPIGIQLIRAFGEVGNLSEPEQKSSMDVVNNDKLSPEERLASVKQFAEFALGGARPEALDFMMKDPAMGQIIKELGINLPSMNTAGRADNVEDASVNGGQDLEALRAEAQQAIERGADAKKVMNKFKNMTGQDLNG